jgi:flagellar biosynthetic protein FliP
VNMILSRPSTRYILLAIIGLIAAFAAFMIGVSPAHAAGVHIADTPAPPVPPAGTGSGLSINLNGADGTPSSSVVTLISITLLAIAPSLILLCTSFTKIFIVLVILRNGIGLPSIPPNQVIAGISLFLTFFIMSPVIGDVWSHGVQPYMDGHSTFQVAVDNGTVPLQKWMLHMTRESDIALITRAAGAANPKTPADVSMVTLVPAFLLSELRSAFIIGFVIVIPFLIIDIVVAAVTMSMGMMMLPPTIISIAVKIGFVVLADTWGVVITGLIGSYK